MSGHGGLGLSDVVRLVVRVAAQKMCTGRNIKLEQNKRLSERYKLKMFVDPTRFRCGQGGL